jgi:DNA-binding MarR family transcriptional regulator
LIPSAELLQITIDRFWETIPSVWGQIRGNIRSIAAENYAISVEQFQILRHVRRGIRSVSDLASVKQLSRSAISQSVDVLVEMGLITRTQSTEDRRYIELELSQAGTDLLNAIFEENHRWMAQKMTSLNAEELERILTAFQLLKSTFTE